MLDFGITCCREQKNSQLESALDHAFTNKHDSIYSYFKSVIDHSDHDLICVQLKCEVSKALRVVTTSRDFRKSRNNPKYFLNELSKIEWSTFVNMKDVDEMENFWTEKINACLDSVAPWRTRKVKQNRHSLPKELKIEIQMNT